MTRPAPRSSSAAASPDAEAAKTTGTCVGVLGGAIGLVFAAVTTVKGRYGPSTHQGRDPGMRVAAAFEKGLSQFAFVGWPSGWDQRPDDRLLLPEQGRPDQRSHRVDGTVASEQAGRSILQAGGQSPRTGPNGMAGSCPHGRRPNFRAVLRSKRTGRLTTYALTTRWFLSSSKGGSTGSGRSSKARQSSAGPKPKLP